MTLHHPDGRARLRGELTGWRAWVTRGVVPAFAAADGLSVAFFTWLPQHADALFVRLEAGAGRPRCSGCRWPACPRREGPSVRIAAGVMHHVRRWLAPSLAVGPGIGSDVAGLTGVADRPALISPCMAAFHAAMTQAPMATFASVMKWWTATRWCSA